jgi:xanthine dehydrogenase small subunit
MTNLTLNQDLSFCLNGERISLTHDSPTQTLLQYLQHSGRTGTKEGCGDGDCGACTVVVLGQDATGHPQYQAINTCLIPLAAMADRDILTVEGIANGSLHPVQAAMVQTGGSQCGYCTPGFIMSLFAAYYDGAIADAAVEGNLCRCTGYLAIRRAAQQLNQGDQPRTHDPFAIKLQQPPQPLPPMQYQGNGQQFYRPTSLSDVLTLLDHYPEATLIAGATDLGLEMSHHRRVFPLLISLEAVPELLEIQDAPASIEIGAAVPLSQIQRCLQGLFPSLDTMLHWFAAGQIRNRATLGGNLGTASPIGDLPPVLLALNAQLKVASLAQQRTLPLDAFFTAYRQTELRPGEVIVSVQIPKTMAPGATHRFNQSYKVGKRGTDDISIVAAAFTIDLDAESRIVQARLAYGGVAATPVRAIAVEAQLVGQPWTMATIQRIKPTLRAAFTPLTDLRGSAEYRRRLVANLFEKFFVETQEQLQSVGRRDRE